MALYCWRSTGEEPHDTNRCAAPADGGRDRATGVRRGRGHAGLRALALPAALDRHGVRDMRPAAGSRLPLRGNARRHRRTPPAMLRMRSESGLATGDRSRIEPRQTIGFGGALLVGQQRPAIDSGRPEQIIRALPPPVAGAPARLRARVPRAQRSPGVLQQPLSAPRRAASR